jgi:hypothetical protein
LSTAGNSPVTIAFPWPNPATTLREHRRRAVANRNRYSAHIAQLQVRGVMWVTRRSFVERAARTERVVSFAGYSAGACG